ncbi:hypothetical protein T190820D02B_120001 [Tenacibaculum sp. 190524A05c]
MTTDPAGQFSSPYLGMGNNPISRIDPDGGYSPPTDFINKQTGEHKHVKDGINQIILVDNSDWINVINYSFDVSIGFKKGISFGDTPILPNFLGIFRFPETGKGFARYSVNFNNENYTAAGQQQTGDNYISKSGFIALYKTFVEFNDLTGYTAHYGDISAFDPRIQLGHSSHFRGSAVDIHYIGNNGVELFGNSAYSSANVITMNNFFEIAENNGFTSNFSYGNRFMHKVSTLDGRNNGVHLNHFHIGLPDSWTNRQGGVRYGNSSTVPLPGNYSSIIPYR